MSDSLTHIPTLASLAERAGLRRRNLGAVFHLTVGGQTPLG